jgi:hypothetical protein
VLLLLAGLLHAQCMLLLLLLLSTPGQDCCDLFFAVDLL